jgi:hypothetical protein
LTARPRICVNFVKPTLLLLNKKRKTMLDHMPEFICDGGRLKNQIDAQSAKRNATYRCTIQITIAHLILFGCVLIVTDRFKKMGSRDVLGGTLSPPWLDI